MGQALYRKHRPKSLLDVVGQEHITTTLSHALKQGKISHAYLFTGPRGTGKTSVARILAHEANNLPYADDQTHLDIIEIDAASNRRIDEIRDLRDKVNNAPASAKYKVYIIDEVHMLTREAFNALLKTLEEPPAHVIFILATTEAHKLPETIISRTQRFAFKPVEIEKVVEHLKTIANVEGMAVDKAALDLVAAHGSGSFRDSISLLDQASASGNKISLDTIQQLLGLAPEETIKKLLATIQSGTPSELLDQLDAIRAQGIEPLQLAKQLAAVLREQVVDGKTHLGESMLTDILQQLVNIAGFTNPYAQLEIILLSIILSRSDQLRSEIQSPAILSKKITTNNNLPNDESTQAMPLTTKSKDLVLDEEAWQQALLAIKEQHNTLYSLARMASPQFTSSELILNFGFPFHQKRVSEVKNKTILGKILKELTGKDILITCVVAPHSASKAAKTLPSKSITTDNTLETISNIFGPSEVLES